METIFQGTAGRLHISDPELYVDNQSRKRSGHMSHAMLEYAPGKIIAFNSNCSAERFGGHAAFGFIEYRYSDDGGKSWGEIHVLPYSMKILLDGIYTISVEKAVISSGVITLFALRNSQSRPICCEPWDTPLVIQSHDFGKTWTEPVEFSKCPGRIYDAVVHDGSIFVLEHCCPKFYALPEGQIPKAEDGGFSGVAVLSTDTLYRLYRSDDDGKTFYEVGPVDIEFPYHAYGSLQFRPDGSLIAYSCNIGNGYLLSMSLSTDCGKTWMRQEDCKLDKGIRNVQVGMMNGKYVMHGRAFLGASWGKGLVAYTSNDGLNWDEGILLEPEKQACYYSNNLLLKDENGHERLLVQYSDGYDCAKVNVMHRWLSFE